MMELIAQGAEAKVYDKGSSILKKRIKKSYRHSDIDFELRKTRTTREANILKKLAASDINSPRLLYVNKEEMELEIEKIEGKKLSDSLEKLDYKRICIEIGKMVGKMHSLDIIHGDLTTSNMILCKGKIFFIDFGLSFSSDKTEDKAVDLHLFRQALCSTHHEIADECFSAFMKVYAGEARHSEAIFNRYKVVEQRGRHKLK